MDYRPIPSDRLPEFKEYLEYAFSPEDGPEADHDWTPEDQPGQPRAMFEDEQMRCVCRHYWFRTRLRGEWFEMPGISAVAAPPEHRRNGYVSQMLAESLAEYRDRGDFLTGLWATEHSIYGGLGWGLANKYAEYEFAPEVLAFTRSHDAAGGEFRRLELDDYDRLDPLLATAGEDYELFIDRTETWWKKRVLANWQADFYVYGWADEDGEIRGYLVYRVEAEDDGKRLRVVELATADHEARLNLLRFLANHDSQVERVSIYGPPETDLFDVVADPSSIECEMNPGPMIRLVDVPTAIETFDYPEPTASEFTLSVADPLADWNDRTFQVTLADGRATCEPAGEAEETDPDVSTSVSTLSQVVVGYHSVPDAERLGDLEIRTPEARETLTAMFPEREVFLREGF